MPDALRLLIFIAVLGWTTGLFGAELSPEEKNFLASYEKIHAALAADNLKDAKAAATEMGEDGKLLAQTESIITARKEFENLSARAIEMTKGQNGFFVVNCPMLKKDWVQTSEKISNPYAGREMLTCGVVRH